MLWLLSDYAQETLNTEENDSLGRWVGYAFKQ